jgi:hypothetical protein
MQILLTDSAEIYEQSTTDKILTDGFVIVNSTIFDHEQTAQFNARLNGVENEASRLMIKELESVCETFPDFKAPVFLETRDLTYHKAYSLLYADFKDYITKKFLIEMLVKKLQTHLPEITEFSFDFGNDFKSIEFSNFLKSNGQIQLRKTTSLNDKRFVKNLFYRWSRLKRKKTSLPNRKYRIALFIFDTINDIDLFRTFFQLIKSDETVHLDIIQIDSGIAPEKVVSAKPFECKNIAVYKLQDFRAPLLGGLEEFSSILTDQYPEYSHFAGSKRMVSYEAYNAFIHAALTELKPTVVAYDNTGEVGRYLSDVARYHKIPSANIEYGLFSNDYIHMASNICYDIRYCLGEASVSIWKDKKDPTKNHVPIGFLKLDHSEQLTTNGDDFKWIRGTFDKLVFFASTWAGTNSLYNNEKTVVVKELSEICVQNNWGLIIKKHPAEKDTLLDELEEIHNENVFLYQHHEAQLFQILKHCDIVCTQNSSITAEALLHRKPTIFYNKSEQPGLAELIPMSKEPFVFFVSNKEQFMDAATKEIPAIDVAAYDNTESKYLYKTDQKASHRLLHELKKLSNDL